MVKLEHSPDGWHFTPVWEAYLLKLQRRPSRLAVLVRDWPEDEVPLPKAIFWIPAITLCFGFWIAVAWLVF
jgi:hypothetical protein